MIIFETNNNKHFRLYSLLNLILADQSGLTVYGAYCLLLVELRNRKSEAQARYDICMRFFFRCPLWALLEANLLQGILPDLLKNISETNKWKTSGRTVMSCPCASLIKLYTRTIQT
jgi:hypothetical protein